MSWFPSGSSVIGLPGLELGQLINASFQILDLLSEFFGLLALRSCELIFKPLKAALFSFFVDLCLANVLAFFDLVYIAPREFSDVQCVVDFLAIHTQYALAVDPCFFERFEHLLVVFQRSIASGGPLNGTKRSAERNQTVR